MLEALTELALRLGVGSLRTPWLALRAARAAAARDGRTEVNEADLLTAAALVLGPRARALPPEEAPAEPPPPAEDDRAEDGGPPESQPEGPARDVLLEAAKAVLPKDLLERLAKGEAARGGGSGGGARRRGNRRGRPLAARPGRLDGSARIDLVATLRAAAPWQPLRRREGQARLLVITRDDIRVRRFEEHSDRLLILSVDASGSAAAARLAEAKGALRAAAGGGLCAARPCGADRLSGRAGGAAAAADPLAGPGQAAAGGPARRRRHAAGGRAARGAGGRGGRAARAA